MNSWLVTEQLKSGNTITKGEAEQVRYTEIDNYYGAHKNFKTDFRNKKYRNVYMQLIHRKPAQPEYKVLYYQDILISIIKTLEISFLGKEGHIGPIEPFFYFGTKAIKQFYWLFLFERRIINQEMAIDPSMQNKISNFLTLIIDFCCKISMYLFVHSNLVNSQKIFNECYHNVVKCVIDSSTSNLLLLKKCGQFLLQYATFCLKTEKYSQAHEILKDGLKNQLNQLILLKYDIKRRKKLKKNLKRYSSTLKTLSHFYINLGLYYEKQSNMYQCATAILDAVLVEELISKYKAKMKKWVCGLEQSYIEEKNKFLEITRICNKFFEPQFLEEFASKAKKESNKNINQNERIAAFYRKGKKSMMKSSVIDGVYQPANLHRKQGEEKQKHKLMKTKRSNERSVKEVRFKLNEEIIQTKSETNTVKFSEKKIYDGSPSNQDLLKQAKAGQNQNNQCQSFKQVISYKNLSQQDQLTKKLKNNSDNMQNNQFLLFGQSFWETKKSCPRSKSTAQKMQNLFELEMKKTRRKLSYNNISYIEANSLKNKVPQKNKKANKFLKQNYFENGKLRKRGRDKGLFLQRSEQNPDNINEVDRKISEWHKSSAQIQTDLMNKMGRLKQRKKQKNGLDISDTVEYVETERQSTQKQQKSIALIQQDFQAKRNQEILMRKSKKQSSISIFKKFLIENKAFFNISKVQLLNTVADLESQKRYLSFLIAEKPEKVEKFVQKNHWQAKFNIQYFMNQIQESNKKLNKSQSKTKKIAMTKHVEPSQFEHLQPQKPSNMQIVPSNLFGTSLKSRAQQLVKLL